MARISMLALASACVALPSLSLNNALPAAASFSGTAHVWFQTIDSCKLQVPSAEYQILDNNSPQFNKLFTQASGPRNQVGSGTCPLPRGNCNITPNTGCAEVDLPYPNTYTMHEVATPPADSSNPQGYAPCTGGSACQAESSTIVISSSGVVTATTTNVYPDGKSQVWPSSTTTFNGSQTDPIITHNFGLGTGSCDGDSDADDHLTGSPSSHCAFPEAQEGSVTTCGGSIYPWSCTLFVTGSGNGPGPATHLQISLSTLTQTAGVKFSATLTALDANNVRATSYTGAKTITWSGAGKPPSSKSPTYPSNPAQFSNGAASVSMTLYDAQTFTLGFTDGTISGSLPGLTVVAGPPAKLGLSKPGTVTAGTPFTETVTAQDTYGNTAPTYPASKTLTWSGPSASSNGTQPIYQPASGQPVQFSNGVAKATIYLFNAASTTLTVTDGTFTTKSSSFTVNSSTTGHLLVSAPATAAAGTSFGSITLTATDQYNNVTTGFSGTKTIQWSGPSSAPNGAAPSLPATSVTFSSGVSTTSLSATIYAGGPTVLTAKTTASPVLIGSSPITVSPGAASHFALGTPAPIAGTAFGETVTALDAYNNVAAYTGAHSLTWSGPHTSASNTAPAYPTAATSFIAGAATAAITLYKSESTALSVTDGSISGSSSGFTVSPSTLSQFAMSGTTTAPMAGVPFSVTLIAQDAYGNRDFASYAGSHSLHFIGPSTSPLGNAPSYPSSTTFSWDGSKSSATAQVTLFATQTVDLIAGEGNNVFGTLAGLQVEPATASLLRVLPPSPIAPATSAPVAGVAFNETVIIADPYGNPATSYGNPPSPLPASTSFTYSGANPSPSGVQPNYPGQPLPISNSASTGLMTLANVETIQLTVTAPSLSLSGVSSLFSVSPGSAASFIVSTPSTATAGTPFNLNLTANDVDGNLATGYSGLVNLSFAGPGAAPNGSAQPSYPASATFSSGTLTAPVPVTLVKAETASITAGDGTISGTSQPITVVGASTSGLALSAPSSVTAGQAFSALVTAVDSYGNPSGNYGTSQTLTWSGPDNAPDGTAPSYNPASGSTVTFSGPTGSPATSTSVQVTLPDAESTTLRVTDGTYTASQAITVQPGPASSFAMSGPGSTSANSPFAATAGSPFNVTITALDGHQNAVSGYSNPVSWGPNDQAAGGQIPSFPSALSWSGGSATASITMYRAEINTSTCPGTGATNLTVTDGSASGSEPMTVSPASQQSLQLSVPTTATAGAPLQAQVTSSDPYGNLACGDNSALTVSDSDSLGGWVGTGSMSNGTAQLNGDYLTPGSQSLAVSEDATDSAGSCTNSGDPLCVSGTTTVSLTGASAAAPANAIRVGRFFAERAVLAAGALLQHAAYALPR